MLAYVKVHISPRSFVLIIYLILKMGVTSWLTAKLLTPDWVGWLYGQELDTQFAYHYCADCGSKWHQSKMAAPALGIFRHDFWGRKWRRIVKHYLWWWYQMSLQLLRHLSQNHKYQPHCGAGGKVGINKVIRIHPFGTTNWRTNVLAIIPVVIEAGPQTDAASEAKNTD